MFLILGWGENRFPLALLHPLPFPPSSHSLHLWKLFCRIILVVSLRVLPALALRPLAPDFSTVGVVVPTNSTSASAFEFLKHWTVY